VRRRTAAASAAVWAASGAIVLVLVACSDTDVRDVPPTAAAPVSPPPTEADGDPALGAATAALADLARFDEVNLAVIEADAEASGLAFVDALAAAGFDRAAMQVTSDTTTLGEPADSIQFSVRIGDRCLIGQYGPASDGYRSTERPGLGAGGCLVGATVPLGG